MYYDIGANVGVYTCFAGQHADRVVAFEPHEGTATRLRENVDLNDIDVTVYQTAVADYEGPHHWPTHDGPLKNLEPASSRSYPWTTRPMSPKSP